MEKGHNVVESEINVSSEEAKIINQCFAYLGDILTKYNLGQLRYLDEDNMRLIEIISIPIKPIHYSS